MRSTTASMSGRTSSSETRMTFQPRLRRARSRAASGRARSSWEGPSTSTTRRTLGSEVNEPMADDELPAEGVACFGRWVADSPLGAGRAWWDGLNWNSGIKTDGSWSSENGIEKATWMDGPGWKNDPNPSFPWALDSGFITRVSDRRSGDPIKGMVWNVDMNAKSSDPQTVGVSFNSREATAEELKR